MVYKNIRLLYLIEKDVEEKLPLEQIYTDYNQYIQSKDKNVSDHEEYLFLFKNFREHVLSFSKMDDMKVTSVDNKPYNKFDSIRINEIIEFSSLESLYKALRSEFFNHKTSRFYMYLSTGIVDIVIPKSRKYDEGILLTLQEETPSKYLETLNELLYSDVMEKHIANKNFQNVMVVSELYIDFLRHLLRSPRISLFIDYSDKIVTSVFYYTLHEIMRKSHYLPLVEKAKEIKEEYIKNKEFVMSFERNKVNENIIERIYNF